MSTQLLTADFFKGNRQRLIDTLPEGSVVIVPAHSRLQRNRDVAHRFRQDSNFYYLTGIEQPYLLLVMAPDHPRRDFREVLIIPRPDRVRRLWEGQASRSELRRNSGINNFMEWGKESAMMRSIITSADNIYYPLPPKSGPLALNPAAQHTLEWLRHRWPSIEIKDIRPQLGKLRMVKQPQEVSAIKQAISITNAALTAAKKLIRPNLSEYELAAKVGQVFWNHNMGEAFPSIVAAGANACTIHYETGQGLLKTGELVLFDVGAEYLNYAADISRTLPISGRFTKRQQAVYQAVKQVQHAAMKLLKPGIKLGSYERQVAELMKQQLMKIGLLKQTSPLKAIRRYFPHGTSHFLGLDVHDEGIYKKPLEPGIVLTVEPGIYIADEGIGIRIEDDVLITEGGCENLSADIPVVQ